MSRPIIAVDRLSKKYRLGVVGATTLREEFANWRRRRGSEADSGVENEFWALREVSFDIAPGEVVGIVGPNGAGKSTLLKTLSRITEPTSGRAVLRGKVASLLEVGTGFHPDLTGRENVFLNGAILGMKRPEIAQRFDQIVAFAEVEKFIDTPVKHYSSGMRVRLAFAVAAHLEAEILIVDEVLAVGDAAFQQRCLTCMSDLAQRRSRTILFVSHQLEMVRRLTTRSLLLQGGRLVFDGPTADAIARHTAAAFERLQRAPAPPPGDAAGCILEVHVTGATAQTEHRTFAVGEPWRATVKLQLRRPIESALVALAVRSADGIWIRTGWSRPRDLPAGVAAIEFSSGTWRLAPGRYYLAVGLSSGMRSIHYLEEAAVLEIGHLAVDDAAVKLDGVGMILDPWETRWE